MDLKGGIQVVSAQVDHFFPKKTGDLSVNPNTNIWKKNQICV